MNIRTPQIPPTITPINNRDNRPLWSVMIPAYNCISYLQQTMQSVLKQDQGEHLMQIEVIDDSSTDGDVESLVEEVGKGRVKYFRQTQNAGSLRNFETCIKRSRGHYVHLLHGDDKVELGYYDKIEKLFNNNPEAGAAFTNYNFIDGLGKKTDILNKTIQEHDGIIPDFINKIAVMNLIQPPAMTVKRSVYETIGSFYAVHFGEDWEMWVRIASRFPVAYSPESLASYRTSHGIGISHGWLSTGQNIKDVAKVISIIQHNLPKDKKAFYKNKASALYAYSCIANANFLLQENKQASLTQIRGSWKMYKSFKMASAITRYYFKYIKNGLKLFR